MKVVIIGTIASSITSFRVDLIKALVIQGHSVFAFAINYTHEQRALVKSMGAEPVDYTFSRSGLNPLRDIKDTIVLAKQLKAINPDLVFSYFAKPVVFGTLAARLAKVPHRIAMLEGLGYTFTEQPHGLLLKTKIIRSVQVFLYRLSFPFLARLVFLNPNDPVDLLEKYNLKVKKVGVLGGIGLNLADYPYSVPKTQPVRFIFIGRLLVEKGINEYIAAASLVKSRYPTAEFVVLGDLDESNPGCLKRRQIDLLIEKNIVIYPGQVNNVQEWLANSSVFVLPSYREGVPRSTQEAMAIGRAVITTDVPGCRETVVNNVNGFIVPPWSPEKLAEKMIRFIEQPELIETMGRESYRIAQEKFDAYEVNQRLVAMLLNS